MEKSKEDKDRLFSVVCSGRRRGNWRKPKQWLNIRQSFVYCEGDQALAHVARRGSSGSISGDSQYLSGHGTWQRALLEKTWTKSWTSWSPEMPSILWFYDSVLSFFSFNKIHKSFFQSAFGFLHEHVFRLYFRMLHQVCGERVLPLCKNKYHPQLQRWYMNLDLWDALLLQYFIKNNFL